MRVFITGASGLLGSNLVSVALDRGHQAIGSYHTEKPAFDAKLYELDIRDTTRFLELLRETSPDIVINCAAMTDVDLCEKMPEKAHTINAQAPGMLAKACHEAGIQLMQISTDYVFDGRNTTPYAEADEPNPIQVYGTSKREGELAVLNAHETPIITRVSFLYGRNRATDELAGFPAWILAQINRKGEVPLFSDQRITPSRAEQSAQTILELIEGEAKDIYHVASRSCVTPYDFGLAIARQLGIDSDIFTETTMDAIDRQAARPTYTCLSVEKAEQKLGRTQPTLIDDLIALKIK